MTLRSFRLDTLDKRILQQLDRDARIPYTEIAKTCRVSGAAIHQRVNKMKEAGVLEGTSVNVNVKALGYQTCAFIGVQVNLTTQTTHTEVFEAIRQIPEIVECHHISGKYSLLLKLYTQSNEHLKQIIVEQIQSIPAITFTETFISLEEGFDRKLSL